jgi:hypothetical protein
MSAMYLRTACRRAGLLILRKALTRRCPSSGSTRESGLALLKSSTGTSLRGTLTLWGPTHSHLVGGAPSGSRSTRMRSDPLAILVKRHLEQTGRRERHFARSRAERPPGRLGGRFVFGWNNPALIALPELARLFAPQPNAPILSRVEHSRGVSFCGADAPPARCADGSAKSD